MIEARTRTMYWAPTRRRHYATLSQACLAEARAIIKRRFQEGGDEGWWGEYEHLHAVAYRYARLIERRSRAAMTGGKP